jgi:hypothetical protein
METFPLWVGGSVYSLKVRQTRAAWLAEYAVENRIYMLEVIVEIETILDF